MTSNHNVALDTPPRDASSSSPPERRTTSTFSGSTKRYSIASNETGESSTAASKRNSLAAGNDADATGEDDHLKVPGLKDGKGSHRSHRSRNSGGFLLSSSTFEAPENLAPNRTPERRSPRDKGKAAVRSHDRKRKSNIGLGIGGSPLAANVTSAANGSVGNSTAEGLDGAHDTKANLDVDSAHIVNLALNLSESRKNAARRNVSSPLPPLASTFGEGFSGGSLRQHLQQQRRVSRNVSPKPKRASTASPQVPKPNNSPLHDTFDTQPDGQYKYQFTASTLARAEKAKNQLELMYQYRRLLDYVPPLKPQALERSTTAGSGVNDPFTLSQTASNQRLQNGRPYNPLQYIRNRKVRARERKAIDGEAQGFGDLDKVSAWVDKISEGSSTSMPVFSKAAEIAASPHASPHPTIGKSPTAPAKVKRPRIDWEFNPADMLADVFWLEQEDNKKVVEDRLGRKVFPQISDSRRPMSRPGEVPEPHKTPESKRPLSPDLRIDTKLPEFRSMKDDKNYDSATARVRHKIRDATRINHVHNGSTRESHQFLRARSRSGSDSSDTDGFRFPRRSRSGTADTHDRGRDILEKQMLEMLAKEARENELKSLPDDRANRVIQSSETRKLSEATKSGKSSVVHSRSGSIAAIREERSKQDARRNPSSGRASLEVPGDNPRGSLEELDSTAPSSPEARAKISNAFVPSISMDLSPAKRQPSPSRNPLLRVKSKMNPFEHSRTRSRGRTDASEISVTGPSGIDEQLQESPQTPERRRKSISPVKRVISRRTDDSTKSSKISIRKGKAGDEASGIRGLFKGNRGPVGRVSEFLWKKESPVMGTASGFSTDESDVDDRIPNNVNGSRDSSAGQLEEIGEVSPEQEKHSYLSEMPTFERRGRPITQNGEPSTLDQRKAREERRKVSRASLLEATPRIDIQNASPASSPDLGPDRRESSVSDIDSRRGSYPNGVRSADARLNYILGLPGHRRAGFPVTGLSTVEARRESRPSIAGKRQWSISDRGVSTQRGPMTKREIARVRALLLSSGIKAKEISRRAAEIKDLHRDESPYSKIVKISPEKVKPVPKSQEHLIAAQILSDDIQLSKQVWQASADVFCNTSIQDMVDRIEAMQTRIVENLTPMARKGADEADEVSKDLVTSQTLKVKRITDTMDKMLRRRRRRFRWLRRGGWVMVEWALVGVMWMVWLMVVFIRVIMGIGRGVTGTVKWLLFQ